MKQQPISRRTAIGMTALAVMGTLSAARKVRAQSAAPDSPKAKSVVSLVDKAAALVDTKGKSAFADFRQNGSEWFHADTYVFILDLNGVELFNAPRPDLEGKNLIGLKDKTGKAFHQAFVDTVKAHGAGWVDYLWPKPGTDTPMQKWSYVKAVTVDGTPALLGVGMYLD